MSEYVIVPVRGRRGEFREIDAPGRLVHSERVDGAPEDAGHALCTLVLTEDAGRTTMRYTMRFPTPEMRDQAMQTGMTDGMGMSYDRLEEQLREGTPAA